jgi:hypothetical protein
LEVSSFRVVDLQARREVQLRAGRFIGHCLIDLVLTPSV